MIGIISGLNLITSSFLITFKKEKSINRYGRVLYYERDKVLFIPRHGTDENYRLPSEINHQANIQCFRDKGVTEIIGINSTGSLRKSIRPGAVVVPDDFIMLYPSPTVCPKNPRHIVPLLDGGIRQRLIKAIEKTGIKPFAYGTYWQTAGPRLETKAEIRMMAKFAHIVGMTMASEAIIAKEFNIPYASLCSVDNFAHGVADKELSDEDIILQAKENAFKITKIISVYIDERLKGT